MAEFPAFPLFTDAYLGDTKHLKTVEHGAYLLLLICMWRSPGQRLPNDPQLLARYAGVTNPQWKRIAPILMPFFTEVDGWLEQGRLKDEAQYVRENSSRQSTKAKARWLKTKGTPDAPAIPEACPPPHPTPPKKKRVLVDKSTNSDFEEFWKSIPKRIGSNPKHPARLLYEKFVKAGVDPAKINAAAKRWHVTEPKPDTEYCARAVTWLSQRRFEDYHAEPEVESNVIFDEATKLWEFREGYEPTAEEREAHAKYRRSALAARVT